LLHTEFAASEAVANAPRTIYGELSVTARYTWNAFAFTCVPLLAVRDNDLWAELTLGAAYSLNLRMPVKGY